MSSKLSCEVCGGSNYYVESGFYFCNECHAQSQEVIEEVVNPEEAFAYGRSRSVKSTATPSSQASTLPDHDWTTWEAYNFVLKGMVDELISFGAPPELKIVVLQLWVRLLKGLGVAFLSKRIDRVPKLGVHYHDKDMFIVYGVSNKSKVKKTKKKKNTDEEKVLNDDDEDEASEGSATTVKSSTPSKRGLTKKALAQADYDSTYIDTSGDDLSLLDCGSSSSSFCTSTKKSVGKRNDMFSAKAKRTGETTKMRMLKTKDNKKRQHDPSYITRSRLLAIIYLGLRLIGSKIFLGDLMRWISEGVLSFYEVSHLFPEGSNLKAVDGLLFGTFPRIIVHSNLREKTAELSKLLHVDDLEEPDISSLVARYVEELQLPRDVLECVNKLLAICNPDMKFDLQAAEIPNYEARAMAFIIIVLKILFGLDGKTEYKISETAAKFNSKYCSSETPKLFVFQDWRQYIECRKAFISLFHFPTKDAVYRDSKGGVDLYVEELKLHRQRDENGSKRIIMKNERMNPSITSVLERTLEKLLKLEPGCPPSIKFAPALMPYTSYLQKIEEVYIDGANYEHPFPELLREDFKATELKFLLDPETFVKNARANGMKIKLCKTSAQKKVKHVTVKGRNEGKKVFKVFLKEESKKCSGSKVKEMEPGTDSAASSANWEQSSEVTEQYSVEDSVCASEELCDSANVSVKQNKRKRKHSDLQETSILETSTYSLDGKKRRSKDGCCFNVKHKIGSRTSSKCHDNSSTSSVSGKDSKSKKNFMIYLPSSQYWFLTFPSKRFFGVDMFNYMVMPKFSPAFHWLLSECANLIQVTEWDLYTEVVLMETIFGYTLNPDRKPVTKGDNVSHFLKHVKTIFHN